METLFAVGPSEIVTCGASTCSGVSCRSKGLDVCVWLGGSLVMEGRMCRQGWLA